MPHAGIVTVVGKPNAGKSTLLNRIVGEKLSIVSSKPHGGDIPIPIACKMYVMKTPMNATITPG